MLRNSMLRDIILYHEKFRNFYFKLSGLTVTLPKNTVISTIKQDLEADYGTNFTYTYVSLILTAYLYCENKVHYKTGNLLLDDFKNGKRIYINSYR